MAKTSTLTVSVAINGDGTTLAYVPPGAPFSNAAAPYGGPIPLALSSGDNTVSVPATAQGVAIVPPTGSAVVKKLKGAGADTGVTISPSLPTVINLAAGTASFILNAASTETVTLLWI